MNSQASLPQPHHLKLCGGFAKPVSLAKADAKDLSHLLGGICPLNAFPFRSHMFSFHCAAHLWITVPPSGFSRQAHGYGSLHRVIAPPVPSVVECRTPQELPLQSMEGCSRSLIISAWDRCERAGCSAVDRMRESLRYHGYRPCAALSAAPSTRMNVLCLL